MLRTALAAAGTGRGGVVVVRGETGIGKSRLLAELAGEASATHVVLTGRAIEGGGAFRPIADALVGALRAGHEITPAALGPYGAALGRLLPDWTEATGGAPPETGVDPGLVLGEAVARFLGLVGQRRPCLLVLEDLQWADADSWAVLAHVAVAAVSLPVLVVATVREDGPLSAPAAGLARLPAVTTLLLDRLSRDEVRGLAAALGATDPAILTVLDERADGLPFLVEELVEQRLSGSAGAADVPPTLRGLVEERLERLTDIQRRVLAGAAVLGVDPDWSLLHRVTDVPEREVLEALGAAERVRLLVVDGGTLRWRHSLTRDAVLSLVLPPEVASLSSRAAEALVARSRPEDAAAAADLLLRAGAVDAAADLLLPLTRRELARGGLLTAERLLDDLDRTGLRPAAAAVERCRLLCLRGRAREALELAGPVLDEATGGDHVELALGLARAAVQAGQWDDVRAYVDRAGRPDDPRSPTLLADAAHGAGRLDAARRHADDAVAGAQETGDAGQLCDALVVSAKILRLSDTRAARGVFDRAAQLAAEHGLVDQRVEAVLGLATLDMLESDEAGRLDVARGLAEQAGLVGQLTGIDMLRADAVVVSAGPAAAVPLALELLERGRALAMVPAALAGAYIAALAPAAAGDRTETERLLAALEQAGDGPPETSLLPAGVSAMLALASHDLRAANAALDPAVSLVVSHHSAAPLHQFGLWALLRTVVDDRGDEARRELAQTPVSNRRGNAAALRYAEAVVAGREGRRADADAALREAEDLVSATPWLRRLLRTVALPSAVADGWGDPVPLLRASLAEHERAGEDALARVVRDLLRRAGAPTRRGRGDAVVPEPLAALGVTSREADVLAVLVEGATNAEIAERLFLSRRTVETHVAHLLQKTSSATPGRATYPGPRPRALTR